MENSSLIDTSSEIAGHPASARPTGSCPPTATLAARLAAVTTSSAAHGNTPERRPARCCARMSSEDTNSKPSTLTGNALDFQPVWPCTSASAAIWEKEIAPATTASPATVTTVAARVSLSVQLMAAPSCVAAPPYGAAGATGADRCQARPGGGRYRPGPGWTGKRCGGRLRVPHRVVDLSSDVCLSSCDVLCW